MLESLKILPAGASEDDTVISRSLVVKGDLVAEMNLVISGQIEGNIIDPEYQVTIQQAGRVRGEVSARSVVVEGKFTGTLQAVESVTLCGSADVRGKILAPQVVLEEGSKFNGEVRMDVEALPVTSLVRAPQSK